MRRRIIALIAIFIVVVAIDFVFPLPSFLVVKMFGDSMDWHSRWLVGFGATDCGRVAIRQSPDDSTKCVFDSYEHHRTFRVRYDLQGIDSRVSAGLAMDKHGKVYGMNYDGDPMGGGGTSLIRQRFWKIACPEPVHLFKTKSGRANCFPPNPNAEHSIMDPTFEPY